MCTLTDTGTMSRGGGGGGVREGLAWELGFFFYQSAAEYILRTGQRGGRSIRGRAEKDGLWLEDLFT